MKMFNHVFFLKMQLYSRRIHPENSQQKNIKMLGLDPVFDCWVNVLQGQFYLTGSQVSDQNKPPS